MHAKALYIARRGLPNYLLVSYYSIPVSFNFMFIEQAIVRPITAKISKK